MDIRLQLRHSKQYLRIPRLGQGRMAYGKLDVYAQYAHHERMVGYGLRNYSVERCAYQFTQKRSRSRYFGWGGACQGVLFRDFTLYQSDNLLLVVYRSYKRLAGIPRFSGNGCGRRTE